MNPKLDPEFKAKWIAALRSGNYKQGRAALCVVKDGQFSFCCLGVAADIIKPDGWGEEGPMVDGGGRARYWQGDVGNKASGQQHPSTIPWVLGAEGDEHLLGSLASMNDGGNSFSYIADHIEKNL